METAPQELPKEVAWEMQIIRSEKSSTWYWMVFFVAALVVFVGLFMDNILLAIFAIAGGFAVIIQGSQKPEHVSVELNEKGIRINNKLFLYEHLESFWIITEEEESNLLFKSEKALGPSTRIPLSEIPPELARAYLEQFLLEEEQEESFIDMLGQIVGL